MLELLKGKIAKREKLEQFCHSIVRELQNSQAEEVRKVLAKKAKV
jgi:hypothetical protein